MRILVISHACVVDVNQQVYIDLASQTDTEVMLVTPDTWPSEYTGESIPFRQLAGVKFPILRMPVFKAGSVNLHFYKRLPIAQIRKWKPDVVLASEEPFSASGWQSLCLSRMLHARFAFQTNQNLFKRYPPPFAWFERDCYRSASAAMAYSEEARQVMLRKGRREERTTVVPYFTDVSKFAAPVEPADKSDWIQSVAERRAGLGLADAVVIGYMGRLVPEKGLDTLLDAVAILSKSVPVPVKILFVGSGASVEALRTRANDIGIGASVVFAGVVPHTEAGKYMACMDIFALPSRTTPSWKEQFGRVIIEALASAIPVVGSDSGEIPNLLRATGGGRIFHEGDAADLARQLSDLVTNPDLRRTLAAAGGAVVRERYTSEAVARQLRGVLA